jgi:hypothetical protein
MLFGIRIFGWEWCESLNGAEAMGNSDRTTLMVTTYMTGRGNGGLGRLVFALTR